jgi:hypothetical protein
MEPSKVKPFISLPDPGAYMRSPTGNRVAVRADGTQTGGGFALLEAEDAAGAATPPRVHAHDDEAFLILEGRSRFHGAEDTFEGDRAALPWSRKGGHIIRRS